MNPRPTRAEPPRAVLNAYGLTGQPRPLAGGQARCWLVAGAVLKPLDLSPVALQWQAELLGRLDGRADFRVSPPLRSTAGALSEAGWTAWRYQPAEHRPGNWRGITDAANLLHEAVRAEPRPSFISERKDKWATGDRVAWGEHLVDGPGYLPELLAARRPVHEISQLVHGDLTGNVLFDDALPPLIIDLSPYWRPAAFGTAIVVADALIFHGAGAGLVEDYRDVPEFAQYLLRAVIYRSVTGHLDHPGDDQRYRPAAELALSLS